ncbi:MAG: cache domain-containing protein, partial [Anaerolineaceae bacterium]|nr:cache domain-containing protein [Anaerolineaceae bacterium]
MSGEAQTFHSSDRQMKMSDQRKITRNTLLMTLPIFALMIIFTAVILVISERAELKEAQAEEWRTVDMQAATINSDIQHISSDLALLAHQSEMADLWDDGGILVPEVLAELTAEYLTASTYWESYGQIRLIDENGMEIARVNFNNGLPAIVPQEELQNKEGRYYFDDAFKLNQGEVFVSPLDLNIEHGEIEQPLKPTLRFATPVFDQHGNKRGIVLFNYFGAKLIERFSSQANTSNGSQAMLLNADGYWLAGPNPEDEWGFMYEDREDRTFGNTYPEAWERIKSDESGQFKTSQGLFVFKTIYPLLEGQ